MITIETKGNQIFLFGRENNNVYCKQESFAPYFYVEDNAGEFISIEGKKLKKIKCINPYDINKLREGYSKHYEADVRYVNRFIIDKIKEIKQETIRKCFIDLETKKPETGYDDPYNASGAILCIGCYDNFDKEYKQFVLKDFEDEKEMLKSFINYIRKTDPDMLLAWNGDGFDFPYLLNRIHKLKINVNCLARQNDKYRGSCNFENKYGVSIGGRILFDLMYAYKKWTSGEGRESFSLDYISQYEKLGEKVKYKGSLDELYEKDIELYKKYNYMDVELMVLLDNKLKLVEFFDSLRRLCFCKMEDVFHNSKMADCLCLKYAKDNNFVLPSVNKNNDGGRFQGGFVQNSIPGLHKDIACLDMKSLYPSIMIGFNTSYETLLPTLQEGCINGFDEYYFKRERGIIPSIVKPLLERRATVKKELKQLDKDGREFKTKYMEQYTLKTIANSFYGVLGFKKFRLYRKEIASSITYLSRKTIKKVTKWFEDKGFKVIYGDSVIGSTIINIDSRKMPIENFWDKMENSNLIKQESDDKEIYDIKKINYFTLSLTEKGNQRKNVVNKIIRHKCKKDLYEITTESGKKITVTEDHSLIVKRNGEQKIIKPTELNLKTDKVYTYVKCGNKKGCPHYGSGFKTVHKNKKNRKNQIHLNTYYKTHKNWAYKKSNENSEAMRRRSKSISVSNIEYFKDNLKARDILRQARLKQKFPKQETKLEIWFEKNIMKKLGCKYQTQTIAEKYCKPDFMIKNKKIAIFCDGDFWHANPLKFKNKKLSITQLNNLSVDARQNKYLKDKGWKVIRLYESTIYNNKDILIKLKEKIKCRQNWNL